MNSYGFFTFVSVKTKKKYGQHFLINVGIKEKIVQAIKDHIPAEENLLEIGPGEGVLTKYLVEEDYNLKVCEIDSDMVDILKRDIPALKEDQIIFGDVVRLNSDTFFNKEIFHLVGNFPYNVSSQLLFMMYENKEQIPTMIGMFQKEVADRVVAPPGSKTYGILSVLLQAFYDCKRLFLVSKGSFNPPPKVESAVILLTRNTTKNLSCDEVLFKRVVKMAFSQRRKMLRNTLRSLLSEELQQKEIYTKRPEQLGVEDFIKITTEIEKSKL